MDGSTTLFPASLPDDAILRATSAAELGRELGNAVVAAGEAIAAAILQDQPGFGLRFAGGAGMPVPAQPAFFTDGPPCLAGIAWQSGRRVIAPDFAKDAEVHAWRRAGIAAGAAAAFPLRLQERVLGVLLCFFAEPGELPTARLAYFERLAANAAFRLGLLQAEAEKDRFIQLVNALGNSNEAILRAESREKLFPLVSEAAITGGDFAGVMIALEEPTEDGFHLVCCMLAREGKILHFELGEEEKRFGKQGITGLAFRTGRTAVSNDYPTDHSAGLFPDSKLHDTVKSCAALPLISSGKTIGVLLLVSHSYHAFATEVVQMLEKLAANLSFALENFDREDERKAAEARVKYLATHDNLTDLPNRALFNQLLEFSIQTAGQHGRQCAVLFIDLDRFKVINDSLGHAAGDALLMEMGDRLRRNVRASDVVARLGGDEFMILLTEISDNEAIAAIARNLLSTLAKPLTLAGQECRVTASIGIAKFPEDATDARNLMKHADLAMYRAKAEGKNNVRFFCPSETLQTLNRLQIETGLRQALERNQLSLHYQPKLNVNTRRIAGVEALLRWNHPELGLVPPAQFIPVAEDSGLIVAIGSWVLKTACAQAMAWQRAGLPKFSMAVNVSPRQFSDENLLRDIEAALDESGLEPGLLQIEITESMVMFNVDHAITVLDAIQARGVRLAIDDFGTGYSSMSSLKRFPIDTIKIDRSFVRDLPQNAEDKAIARAIINMGKALGLTIVAEGVETPAQDEFLRRNLCDEIQGFWFGKPVPPERISEFL